jgi:hypothetical protein
MRQKDTKGKTREQIENDTGVVFRSRIGFDKVVASVKIEIVTRIQRGVAVGIDVRNEGR